MNKNLAGYLFAGETLFKIEKTGVVSEKEATPVSISETKATEKIQEQIHTEVLDIQKVFEKPLLVIVNNITDTQKDLLGKILGSVKKSFIEATILDISNTTDYSVLIESTTLKEVISFGVAMSRLNVDMLLFPYQPKPNNNIKFLLVDDLNTIQLNQKDEKKLLWSALKSMFAV